ncbi:MAG: helix-hairpin-helix domain-containing protein, partial [Prevotellaceae bacterium]|nr:helix-hairpin-helix domain-containing protein [Prevotellaceae bacterium]
MKRLLTATPLFLFLLLWTPARAQSDDLPDAVRQIIEDIAGRAEEEDPDMAALYECYESLLEHPLNLNSATAEELAGLQLLTDFQIQSLLEYRKNYGQLYSIHELPLIHGFNEQLAAQLTPFITVATA